MKTLVKLITCLLAFSSLLQSVSWGCSSPIHPISEFDSKQYVFIGEVLDVAGPFKSESKMVIGEVWGLQVKVTDVVYLPQSPVSYVEVMRYDLTPWCGVEGWNREKLLRNYPVGSQVRVIAKESTLLESKLPDGNIRLESTRDNSGIIARNSEPELTTSAESVYDYRKYADRQNDAHPSESNYYLPHFELRKDLLRLRDAASEEEKIKILERLSSFPHVAELDYPKIAQLHVREAKTLKQLNEKWEAWKQKENAKYRK